MGTQPRWKRLRSLQFHNMFDPTWDLDHNFLIRSTPKPKTRDYQNTKWPTVQKQIVIPEQSGKEHSGTDVNPYFLAAGTASGLLLVLFLLIYLAARKKKQKKTDEEQNAQSILVFPSANGESQPQFLTKEIHFSLPPLRSNSLGDLEGQQDNPYDSDIESDTLLVPGQSHNHRSNSFSCYGLGVIEPALYKSTLDLDELSWPDDHIGRIWFSLRYEPSTEKLLVSLLKAKNLPTRSVGTINNCDPFVRLHLMPDERRYLQSKQKKKTCNPYFDETLVFQVSQKDMADHILKLSVIDGGRTKRNAEIGHVTYPLKELEIGDGSEQQLFKMDLAKEPQEIRSDLGELLISLLYNENLSRLTATVIEAKRLKCTNEKPNNMHNPPQPRPNVSNVISSKINQLYNQRQTEDEAKITKQQQNELNKKLQKLQNNVPKKLLIDANPTKTPEKSLNIATRELNLSNKVKEAVINVEITETKGRKNVKECITIARKAFKSGRSKSVAFREKQLKGLLKFLENHKKEIEEALHKDLRKPTQETNISEIEFVANDLRYTLSQLKTWIGPEKPKKRIINILDSVYVYNDPYGVVLIMGAWNYPILLTLGPLVGALAAGNTVILKPSELAPATNKLLENVLTNYLDQECFQVHQGDTQESTELLKERFDYIFFTGSSKIGKIIYEAAAKNLTPCTLELGGKCPLYIDDSVNMEKTAKRVLWGRMLNSGQTCVAPDYVLCTKNVQEKFLKEANKIVNKFWGQDPVKSPCLSRIVSEKHYKRLIEFIKSEKVSLGGQTNGKDFIIAPTILTDVNPHSNIMEEEIFGPILPIINIKDHQEAIDFINSREKPLALYVFSNNKKIQNLFLKQTSSGGVSINDTISHIMTENLPFGGVGYSGLGNYHGKYGFDAFSHKKGVLVKDFSYISEAALSLRYPPYSEKKTTLINFILKKRQFFCLDFGWFERILVFCLGMGLALLLQYYFNII